MALLLHWIVSAVILLIVAHLVPGFRIDGFGSALIAAIVIGLVNGTLGLFLKVVTFPVSVITFGLFFFVINALMLKMSAAIVPGFYVEGFGPAFLAAIVLALLNLLVRSIVR